MPRMVEIVVAEDIDLGHVTIEVNTPFRWLTKKFGDDSIRLAFPVDLVTSPEPNVLALLETCPRAKLLLESLGDESRPDWIEIFEDGLEVFLSAEVACLSDALCDDLWGAVRMVASETWSGNTPQRSDMLSLFPRSMKVGKSQESI